MPFLLRSYLKALRRSIAGRYLTPQVDIGTRTVGPADSRGRIVSRIINPFRRSHIFAV